MITLAINGGAGRMGLRVAALASAEPDMKVVGALDAPNHPALGRDVGELAGIGPLGVPVAAEWTMPADVLIDFSSPAGVMARLPQAVARRTAAVVGVTGLSEEQKGEIRRAAQTIPVLFAPNMSVGVNLLFRVIGKIAAALGEEYDVEIVEAHHRFKKDAPSGTAVRLAEVIAEATGRDYRRDAVHGRSGITGERTQREIGMHAIRAGDIVGDHTVSFTTLGERIEVTHRAHTRDTFVRGALRAARFIAGKPPRLYDMPDVLGL